MSLINLLLFAKLFWLSSLLGQSEGRGCEVPPIPYAVFQSDDGNYYSYGESVPFGSTKNISCRMGYVLSNGGASEAICKRNGDWFKQGNFVRFATCVTQQTFYEECGEIIVPRVYGGKDAQLGQLPWMARLGISIVDQPGIRLCGATLISDRWLLTAAHCFDAGEVAALLWFNLYYSNFSSIEIYVGRVNFSQFTEPQQQRLFSIEVIKHPEYRKSGLFSYDYALVKLNTRVRFNEFVRKACLPDVPLNICHPMTTLRKRRGSLHRQALVDGCTSVSSAGWGLTENPEGKSMLKHVNLTIFNYPSCKSAAIRQNASQEREICAGSEIDSRDTCIGDSGGPLMCGVGGKIYVVGVVSHGTSHDCGNALEPSIYSRVCAVLPWIRETLGDSPIEHNAANRRCPARLPNVRNGRIGGRGRKTGTTRQVRCNSGYLLFGATSVVCVNGHWSTPGQCFLPTTTSSTTTTSSSRRRCSARLPNVENGRITGSARRNGRSRRVRCNRGFSINGADRVTCSDGKWSPPGRCYPVETTSTTPSTTTLSRCPILAPAVPNGRIIGSASMPGESRGVICINGYYVNGNNAIFCHNGQWSQPGECRRNPTTTITTVSTTTQMRCSIIYPSVPNGYIRWGNEFTQGAVRYLVCHNRYKIEGSDVIVCRHGEWTQPGSCVAIPTTTTATVGICPYQMHVIANGKIASGYSFAGSRRSVDCFDGFELAGRSYITCQRDGSWSLPGDCVAEKTIIKYPGNGSNYTPNENKCWAIDVLPGYAIKFLVTESNIFRGFFGEGLQVYIAVNNSYTLIHDHLMLKLENVVFYSHYHNCKLCFVSNNDIFTGKGFTLTYEPFKIVSEIREADQVDCETLLNQGYSSSGEYSIYPRANNNPSVLAYCDMETSGGGWTVFQRRVDGSQQFNQTWDDYKQGFGNRSTNFWLGNEALHQLTMGTGFRRQNYYTLLIKATAQDGRSAYVYFDHFYIENEAKFYRIHFNDMPICNNTTDSKGISFSHNHRTFETKDKGSAAVSCSQIHSNGGWWFSECYSIYLNGVYEEPNGSGIRWWNFKTKTDYTNLKKTEMMIRRSKMEPCLDDTELWPGETENYGGSSGDY